MAALGRFARSNNIILLGVLGAGDSFECLFRPFINGKRRTISL